MFERLGDDIRRAVPAAMDEAQRRGDRRIGTDHLLLGLLQEPESLASEILGVDLESARAASDTLDRAALAAIGIDLGGRGLAPPVRTRRRPPLTSGAREALKAGVEEARDGKYRHIQARHLLYALLTRQRPDPAATLLEALGVDRGAALRRLAAGQPPGR
jgi:ATP-dependent Clp protease ATP-binding subunit ClpA